MHTASVIKYIGTQLIRFGAVVLNATTIPTLSRLFLINLQREEEDEEIRCTQTAPHPAGFASFASSHEYPGTK